MLNMTQHTKPELIEKLSLQQSPVLSDHRQIASTGLHTAYTQKTQPGAQQHNET